MEWRAPFLPLAELNAPYAAEFMRRLPQQLATDSLILGEAVLAFEEAFAAYCGVAHVIGVGNGLEALRLALLARGIGPGDEVIVPSNTFIATLLAVSSVGAKPILAEPDEDTFCLGAGGVEALITARTRAIVPVHLYGRLAAMDELAALAKRRGLWLLEDAAQAHGAERAGVKAGAFGHAGAFSFYPGKNLGALGDAGAVSTNDDSLARKLRMLRNYGSEQKYVHAMSNATNSRLDSLQALFLSIKLADLDRCNAERRELARRYNRLIDHPEIRTPSWPQDAGEHVWHLYVVRTRFRAALQEHLARAGVQTLIHYPTPPHRQQAYRDLAHLRLPLAERLHAQVLSLPLYPGMPQDAKDAVIAALNAWRAPS